LALWKAFHNAKDRYTLLSPRLLEELRHYYRMFRPKEWIFFGRDQHQPLPPATSQKIFYLAQERAKLPDKGGIHSLRQNAECRKMPSEARRGPKFLRDSCFSGFVARHFSEALQERQ
jgi:integrase